MKLGFVGCGSHAEKLARVLTELGAAIVCHDRASSTPGPEWAGARMPWRDMLTAGLDGIVAAATPEVTTEVLRACLARTRWLGVLATKPLLLHDLDGFRDDRIDACAFVDLWRLYSPAWQAFKADLRGKAIESVSVVCVGNGPIREFSGVLDYGPHALAFVHDLLGTQIGGWWRLAHRPGILALETTEPGFRVSIETGNAADGRETQVMVRADGVDYRWWELSEEQAYAPAVAPLKYKLVSNHRDVALRAFCRAFLNGEPNDTLRLSVAGMRVLKEFDV